MRATAIVFMLFSLAEPAFAADEIPEYDVKGLCQHQASAMMAITHEVSQSVLKSCYREQQNAYEALKRIWPKVPGDIRRKDGDIAKSPNASAGYGDYDVLNSLVRSDMEKLTDAKHNENFQFKR
jgi:hypothetical protein